MWANNPNFQIKRRGAIVAFIWSSFWRPMLTFLLPLVWSPPTPKKNTWLLAPVQLITNSVCLLGWACSKQRVYQHFHCWKNLPAAAVYEVDESWVKGQRKNKTMAWKTLKQFTELRVTTETDNNPLWGLSLQATLFTSHTYIWSIVYLHILMSAALRKFFNLHSNNPEIDQNAGLLPKLETGGFH